jgi:hypothetical protein
MAIEHRRRQRGAAIVELALALPLFLLVVFGTMEMARMMYLWNTLQEVSRRAARAAAVTDFSDSDAMQRLRWHALFRSGEAPLPLASQVGPAQLHIEYLSLDASGTMQPVPLLPACPAANVQNCARDPNGSNCIRFVRVRVCGSDGSTACAPLPYEPMVPLLPVPATLPPSTAVLRAESLGYEPGTAPCP